MKETPRLNIKKFADAVYYKYCEDRITVREAGIILGISPATFSRAINGKMPDLETFAKCCRWMECKMDDFFTDN
ncbi:MAG: helix-turn-helix transcriptional regulator [Candidatus Sulfotelmatobacter sp.]